MFQKLLRAMRSAITKRALKKQIQTGRGIEPRMYEAILYECINTVVIDLRLFHHCQNDWLTAEELSQRCSVQHSALFLRLLEFLVWVDLLELRDGRYKTSKDATPFLSPLFADRLRHRKEERRWLSHLSEFLRTGQSCDFHETADLKTLTSYHNTMVGSGSNAVQMVAGLEPSNASMTLLDIGGGGGHVSEHFLKRFPGLKATILDLPRVVEHFRGAGVTNQYSDRISYIAADARTHALGTNQYDFVVISKLLHHLQPEDNTALLQRAIESLKPGGVLAIGSELHSRQDFDAGHNFFAWLPFVMSSGTRLFYLEDFLEVLVGKGMPKPKFVPPNWHLSKKSLSLPRQISPRSQPASPGVGSG